MDDANHGGELQFGSFIAPFHALRDNPTLALERDADLVRHLDALGYDEVWIGEHHSAGSEIISSPELFIASVAPSTRQIRFGTGVNSLTYHHPLILADRIVQLDHHTRGRIMFGAGPGQLPTDAHMMGIDPSNQRRMMNESLECLIDLFEGRTVNRETDWFTLRDARVQLLPYQRPRMEMVVACAVTPTGPVTAGRFGLGMLSLAASSSAGYEALADHWRVHAEAASAAGRSVGRSSWRIVLNMHVAETREQALADLEWGAMDLIAYTRAVTGSYTDAMLGHIRTAADAVSMLTTEGLGIYGILQAGTPDDIIASIEALQHHTGGFGSLLFLAQNCASFEATKKSYELFARYVIPHFRDSNRNRDQSLAWANANSRATWGATVRAQRQAIAAGGHFESQTTSR